MQHTSPVGPLTVRVTDIEFSGRLFGTAERHPGVIISLMAGDVVFHSIVVGVSEADAEAVTELLEMALVSRSPAPSRGGLSAGPTLRGHAQGGPFHRPVGVVTAELRYPEPTETGAAEEYLPQEEYTPPQRMLPPPPRAVSAPLPAPAVTQRQEPPPEHQAPQQPQAPQTHLPAVVLLPRAPSRIQGAVDAVPRRTR